MATPNPGDLEWSILESSLDGFWLVDSGGRILGCNQAAAALLGYTQQEMVGLLVTDIEASETPDETAAHTRRVMAAGGDRFVTRHRRKDGSVFDVEISLTTLGPQGPMAAFLRDITATKRLSEALDEKQRLIDSVLEASPDVIYLYDIVDQRNRFASSWAGLGLGYSAEEYLAPGEGLVARLMHPDDLATYFQVTIPRYQGLLDSETLTTEYRLRHKDGSYRWFESRERIHTRGADGKARQIVGLIRDRTREHQATDDLRESRQKYADLFENMDTGFALFEPVTDSSGQVLDYRYLDVNPAHGRLTGRRPGDMVGHTILETDPADGASRVAVFRQVGVSGRGHHGEHFSSSTNRWFSLHCFSPRPGLVAALFADVTDRVSLEARLAESERQLRLMFESTGTANAVFGSDGRLVRQNRASEALLGLPSDRALGLTVEAIFGPDRGRTIRERLDRVRASGQLESFDTRFDLPGGARTFRSGYHPLYDGGQIIGVQIISQDISDQVEAQKALAEREVQLRRAQKLESLGILAGGIAHDFNNILAGIMTYSGLAAAKATDSPARPYLEKIEDGCRRAQALTRQLLTFSKGGQPVLRGADLGSLVEATVQFASHGSASRVVVAVEPGLPPVACDAEQIGQVVSNLVINGLQAMAIGGELRVSVDQAAGGLRCRVADEGEGIAPELIDRIFDPFFTTKASGTGLGLAICHSIIKNHGGTLTVESSPGVGSTFTVWLPLTGRLSEASGPGATRTHRGQGRAVILDDEPTIRDAGVEILRSFGYEAQGAGSTAELWGLVDQPGVLVLGLLDLTLPGDRGGVSCAQELRARGFTGVLVAMSGYSTDPVVAHPSDFGFDAALAKPFSIANLAETLEQVRTDRFETR